MKIFPTSLTTTSPLDFTRPTPSAALPQDSYQPSGASSHTPKEPGHPHPGPEPTPLRSRLLINGREGGDMQPGRGSTWRIRFEDPNTGQSFQDFEIEHGKPMHTIVVSEDLGSFAHVHPYLLQDGSFFLPINETLCDPDNHDAAQAISKAGRYFVFAEVKPESRDAELHRFEVQSSGSPDPVNVTPDPVGPDGLIRKYFKADGQPGGPGDAYQVSVLISDHRPHGMLGINFNLGKRGSSGEYEPVNDVEPWLGMPAHAVLIGSSGSGPNERFFSHLHAGGHGHRENAPAVMLEEPSPGAGPDFEFMLHGAMPPDGIYKSWGQFKRDGMVVTFPVSFQLES